MNIRGFFFSLGFIVVGSLCCLSSISRIVFLRKDLSWLLICYIIIQNGKNQAVAMFYYSGANKKKINSETVLKSQRRSDGVNS